MSCFVDTLRADEIAPPDPARKPLLGKRMYDDVKEEENTDGPGEEEDLDVEKTFKALRVRSFVSIYHADVQSSTLPRCK